MKVFVGEYVTCGGFANQPLIKIERSLRDEGKAMAQAVIEDFAAIADEVHLVIDPRFDLPRLDRVIYHPVAADRPLWPQWIQAARYCDHSLVIAPETDGILAQSVALLQAAGLEILNGFGNFMRCASDKWETARVFAAHGVPHPPTWSAESIPSDNLPTASRWVVKPRDGCGTSSVSVWNSMNAASEAAANTSLIIQPWIEGRPASVSVIVDANERTILPVVAQDISDEDVHYSGGQGPLPEEDQQRAIGLASAAIRALPRTVRGFVGLDIILADDPANDCVLEINPRITTSYVGLRRIVEGNLAARLLGLDRSPVRCMVPANSVCWDAAGKVWTDT